MHKKLFLFSVVLTARKIIYGHYKKNNPWHQWTSYFILVFPNKTVLATVPPMYSDSTLHNEHVIAPVMSLLLSETSMHAF